MTEYSEIVIIYNPFSTGQAELKAARLAERLRKRGFRPLLQATEYAGHAETLAYEVCQRSKNPLIISSSGDGGYNEVVNGLMRAKSEDPGCQPVCGILPAGNANDHRRSVRKHPLIWAITRTEPEPTDLLQLQIDTPDHQSSRYAHSYIGLGITSRAAAELNKETLTFWKELTIVLRVMFTIHPVAIAQDGGKVKRYDSLTFVNIHHMAKILRTGSKADINNGSFRVAAVPHRSQFWLARIALNTLLFMFGLVRLPQQSLYKFSVPQRELIHLDGEVMKLPKGAQITVSVQVGALLTVR